MALTKITRGVIKANENYDTHNINSTGIVTAVSANFTGNVSIGGTLTYQDVTNIDSVGVITARAGVKVPDSQKIFLELVMIYRFIMMVITVRLKIMVQETYSY